MSRARKRSARKDGPRKRRSVRLMLNRGYLFLARFTRGMTLGVRGVAFDGEGRVFLVRHGYLPGWSFPGGGVEVGDDVGAALARELREEGGIRLDAPAALFGVYLNRGGLNRDHIALYVGRSVTQVEVPKPNYEIAESGFFPLDALPEGTTGATRRRLEEIAGTRPPSAEW